ncbi:MAG: hypothetical protein ACTSO2_09955 [Promethearchaeota archaeon]
MPEKPFQINLPPKEKPEHIKTIQVSSETASKKIPGVKVKKKASKIDLNANVVVLPRLGMYFKNFGIVTSNRNIIYNKNKEFEYLCELSLNLDYIASSILGGEIDKLLLQSTISSAPEIVLYLKDKEIIYFAYGEFPIKQGTFILNEMKKNFRDLIFNKDPNNLDKIALYNISNKMDARIKFVLKQFLNFKEVISDKEIPMVDDWIKIHYFGMSYQSVGVISLLLGNDLDIKLPQNIVHPSLDLAETLITAKIEAIVANTIANTQAVPKFLTVKLGYEKYRYIIFETLKNDYVFYILAEGNYKKAKNVIELLKNLVEPVTNKTFDGDLIPFQQMRKKLVNFFFPDGDLSKDDGRIFR